MVSILQLEKTKKYSLIEKDDSMFCSLQQIYLPEKDTHTEKQGKIWYFIQRENKSKQECGVGSPYV